jgi:hypothetical protein
MTNKYDIYDQIAIAIREKTPFIIVESDDDRQIYDNIANYIQKNLTVFYVAEFDDYSNGCEAVIDLIAKIQVDLENSMVEKLVLGIIDRDTRPYIDTQARPYLETKSWAKLQTYKGLFILKYYSIETYFANKNSLAKLISKITYATLKDVNNKIIDYLTQTEQETLLLLFYISVDAFKEHYLGTENYKSIKSYAADEHGSTVSKKDFLENFSKQHLPIKKQELDNFATEKSISMQDIKLIIKGKWYLYHFVTVCYSQIDTIYNKNLDFISADKIFRLKIQGNDDLKIRQMYHQILDCIDETELSDIIQRFRELS